MLKKMSKRALMWACSLPLITCFADSGFAADAAKQPTKEELFAPANISKVSEAYGYFIYKGLDNPVLKLDSDAVIRGIQNARAGKPAPMTEQQYEETVSQLQEYAFQDMADRNLKAAEVFLKDNAKKEGVKIITPGKLQYMVVQPGNGAVVTDEMMPTIKYTGKYLDGAVFGTSETSGPIPISLKQTIPGFREGVLGMKVGEKRRLFIHPELGYGTSGQLLPNSLLIFDVEVVDVKPEPKGGALKDGKITDAQLAAAESLYPDELEESNIDNEDELDFGEDTADSDDDDDSK